MQVKGYDKAPLSLSAVAYSEGARCSLSLSKVFLELVERGWQPQVNTYERLKNIVSQPQLLRFNC